MAYAHHDASHDNQRCGGEAELFSAEQGGDDNIASGLQLAVRLDNDAIA